MTDSGPNLSTTGSHVELDDDFLDWEEWRPDQGSFGAHMVAGSLAGIVEHTVMFPVDTLKTHVQCERCGKMAQPSVSASANGCIHAFKTLVKNEGLARLWRGVGTMFAACVPAHAVYFSVYETAKESLGANQPGHHPVAAATAGIMATLGHDLIMSPMDTIKQRLQLGYYHGMRHCVKQMIKIEGVGSLFVSLPTTLSMNLPFGAIMVTSNESLKKLLAGPNGENATVFTYLAAGSGAGAIASVATTPLDMIKTRLQTQHIAAHSAESAGLGGAMPHTPATLKSRPPRGVSVQTRQAMTMSGSTMAQSVAADSIASLRLNGAFDAARAIYAESGLLGFMRGAVPRLMVASPSVAISWTTYECAKGYLRNWL